MMKTMVMMLMVMVMMFIVSKKTISNEKVDKAGLQLVETVSQDLLG